MRIDRLVNIGKLKSTGDPKKDFDNLTKQVEKELEHIRSKATKVIGSLQTGTVTNNTTVIASSGSGGGSSATTSTAKAGIHSIVSVADQFVSFTGDPLAAYVLSAYFLDSSGQFANIPVVQADWTSTGFTLRAVNIPGVGMLFYMAIPTN